MTPTNSRPPPRLTRVRLFSAILIIQILTLGWFLAGDSTAAQDLRAWVNSLTGGTPRWGDSSLMEKDPRIGTFADAALTKALSRVTAVARSGWLIVAVGDCTSCLKADLAQWEKDCARHGVQMVLLSTANQAEATNFINARKLRSPVILDRDRSITSSLNVVWFGRPYLFSRNMRLMWLSRTRTAAYSPLNDAGYVQAVRGGKKDELSETSVLAH